MDELQRVSPGEECGSAPPELTFCMMKMINITTNAKIAFVVQIALTLQLSVSIMPPTTGASKEPDLPITVAQPSPVPLIPAGYEIAARPMRPELLPITKNRTTSSEKGESGHAPRNYNPVFMR